MRERSTFLGFKRLFRARDQRGHDPDSAESASNSDCINIGSKSPAIPARPSFHTPRTPRDPNFNNAPVLDYSAFPHIVDDIIAYASHSRHALIKLRTVSREFRARVDSIQLQHVVLCTDPVRPDAAPALLSPGGHRIPALSDTGALSGGHDPLSNSNKQRRGSVSSKPAPHIQVLDVLPTGRRGIRLNIVVDTLRAIPHAERSSTYRLPTLHEAPRRILIFGPEGMRGGAYPPPWALFNSPTTTVEFYLLAPGPGQDEAAISLLNHPGVLMVHPGRVVLVYRDTQNWDAAVEQAVRLEVAHFAAANWHVGIVVAGTPGLTPPDGSLLTAVEDDRDVREMLDSSAPDRTQQQVASIEAVAFTTVDEHMARLTPEERKVTDPTYRLFLDPYCPTPDLSSLPASSSERAAAGFRQRLRDRFGRQRRASIL